MIEKELKELAEQTDELYRVLERLWVQSRVIRKFKVPTKQIKQSKKPSAASL